MSEIKPPTMIVSFDTYRAWVGAGLISREAARKYFSDVEIDELIRLHGKKASTT